MHICGQKCHKLHNAEGADAIRKATDKPMAVVLCKVIKNLCRTPVKLGEILADLRVPMVVGINN